MIPNNMQATQLPWLMLLLFMLGTAHAQTPLTVAETTLKVAGLSEETLYYGFAEGDQLVFSFREVNGKELKELEIGEVSGSSLFMDFKTKNIAAKTFHIASTGIYTFRLVNESLGGRVCQVKIQRIPATEATQKFNTTVYWRTQYDTTYTTVQERYLVKRELKPVEVHAMSEYYINSGSNATFLGGKSRITFPVTLPPNTQQWYYAFSASREKSDIEKVKGTFSLIGQLTALVDQTQLLNAGTAMLTNPPGGNVCDVYLLDFENSRLFEAKSAYNYFLNGTRENIKSGIVKMSGTGGQTYYIGIKNPDNTYGIQVAIEVVAIVLDEQWGMRELQNPNVTSTKIPYLKN